MFTWALTLMCSPAVQPDMLGAACRHEIDSLLAPADASCLHAPSAAEPPAPAKPLSGPRKPAARPKLPPLPPLPQPMPHAGQAVNPVLGLGMRPGPARLPAPEAAALWAPMAALQRAASDGCEVFRVRAAAPAAACAGAGARAPSPAPAASGSLQAVGRPLRRSASDSFSFHIPAAPLARSATPALGRFAMPLGPAPAQCLARASGNPQQGGGLGPKLNQNLGSDSQARLAALLEAPKATGSGLPAGLQSGHDTGSGALGKPGLGLGACETAAAAASAQQISAGESLARFSAVIAAQAADGGGEIASGVKPARAALGPGCEASGPCAGASPHGSGGPAQSASGGAPAEVNMLETKAQLIHDGDSGKGAASGAESESGTIAAGRCCSAGSSGSAGCSPASAECRGQTASPFTGWADMPGGVQAASESAESVGDSGAVEESGGDSAPAAPPLARPEPAAQVRADPNLGPGMRAGYRGGALQLQRVSPGAPFGSSISVPESAAPPAPADEATSSAASSAGRGARVQAGPGQQDGSQPPLNAQSGSAGLGAPDGADVMWFTAPQGVTVAGQAGGGSASASTASGSGSGTGTLPGSAARGSAGLGLGSDGGGEAGGGGGAGSDASDGDSVALGWEAESACSRVSCDARWAEGLESRANTAAGPFLSAGGVRPGASLQRRSCTAAEEALPHPKLALAALRRAHSLGWEPAPEPAPGPLYVRAPLGRAGGAWP